MSLPDSFTGKVAFVTGAGSGIGQATARLFAQRGAKVAVVARDAAHGRRTAEEIRKAGGFAEHFSADMEKPEEIEAAVRTVVERFGRLDFAFNNAGTTGDAGPIHQQTLESWNQVIATNLTAVFLCMKFQLTHMVSAGGGVIVNNASGAGVMPQSHLAPYCASKHGVLGLTKTAARDYVLKGVRINAVCPGLIHTPQVERYFGDDPGSKDAMTAGLPMKRMGTPLDIANAVVWLCSPEAAYVSGESLFIDGALACH